MFGVGQIGALGSRFAGSSYTPSTPTLTYFTEQVAMQPWYALSNYPALLKIGTATWVSFQRWDFTNSVLKNSVRLYDHTTKSWGDVFDIGSITGVTSDDHTVPTLCVDDNGYVHSFGGAHNAAEMYWSTATPGDPSTFQQNTSIGTAYAYPHPVFINGVIYLFLRKFESSNYHGYLVKSTGITGGVASWDAGTFLVDFGADSRWYMGNFQVVNGTEIHFCATRADAADDYRKDVFYCIYDTADDTLKNYDKSHSEGVFPVGLTSMDTYYRIVDQTDPGNEGQVPGLVACSSGEKIVIYMDGPSAGTERDIMVVSVVDNVLGDPIQLAVADKTQSSVAVFENSGGTVEAWYTKASPHAFVVGGDVYRRVRDAGGIWGAESLVRAAGPMYGLTAITPVLNGSDDFKAAFGENIGSSTSGISNGRILRAYGYGSGSYLSVPFAPSAETQTYFAAMDVQPSIDMQKALDAFIAYLADCPLWADMEILNFNNLGTEQAALLDATGRHTIAALGNIAFTAGVGFIPDGVAAYLDLGFNPSSTAGLRISQNSVAAGVWSTKQGQSVVPILGSTSTTNPSINIVPRNASDQFTSRVNDATTSTVANADATGFFGITRVAGSGTASKSLIRADASNDFSVNSTGVVNGTMTMFRNNTSYTDKPAPVFFMMTGVSSGLMTVMENLVTRYMTEDAA
jgi:hypothetical protein